MSPYHFVYGLRLRASRAIPGLAVIQATRHVDVQVYLGSTPAGLHESPTNAHALGDFLDNDDRGYPEAITWQSDHCSGYRLRYGDGTVFIVDAHGASIWAVWPRDLTLEDTATYLLGPVLAFVLRLRGITCLHASAFCINGHAVALTGHSGAGKSTTAASFAGRGYPVLTDDLLALEDGHAGIMAQPGYPRLRLWPDSAAILYGAPAALPRLTPNWDKRYLALSGGGRRFEQQPRPLAAVYLLGEHSDDTVAPVIESLPACAGLLGLIASIRGDYHPDRASHCREFALLGKMAGHVPVRRVMPRAGPGSLLSLCDTILDDFRALAVPAIEAGDSICTI